jgi:hypothetical protein
MTINYGKSTDDTGEQQRAATMKKLDEDDYATVMQRKCECPHHLSDERYKHKLKVIYLLLVTLFVCIFLQSYLLLTYVNRRILSDNKEHFVAINISEESGGEFEGSGELRSSAERISRSEIEYYVRSYLEDSKKPVSGLQQQQQQQQQQVFQYM